MVDHGDHPPDMKRTVPVLALTTGCCSAVLSEALSFETGTAPKEQLGCWEVTLGETSIYPSRRL